MSEPRVRLHDLSVTGADDPDAVVAAVRDAVAGAVADGTPTPEALRSAIAASVASSLEARSRG